MKRYLRLLLNLKRTALTFVLLTLMASCGSSKKNFEGIKSASKEVAAVDPVKDRVIERAKTFAGTPYKYGGTTAKGMDCSGLIYTSYLSENIPLPRTSRGMSKLGQRLNLKDVQKGDLLFFETDKKKRVINHVGLVVEAAPAAILFIHSTTSRGVIISSLNENYWKDNFVMARRVE